MVSSFPCHSYSLALPRLSFPDSAVLFLLAACIPAPAPHHNYFCCVFPVYPTYGYVNQALQLFRKYNKAIAVSWFVVTPPYLPGPRTALWRTGPRNAIFPSPGCGGPWRRSTMRRLVIFSVLLAFLAPIAGADEQKIFMYVRDGSRDLDRMLVREVGVMRQMLEDAGYAVDIATPRDEVLATETLALTPTVKLTDVRIEEYAGLVLPCMAPASGHDMPARVDELVAEALELDLPMAASRGSVTSLAKAGALVDRQFAFAGPVSSVERP